MPSLWGKRLTATAPGNAVVGVDNESWLTPALAP